jgi:hypothetical protein
MLINYQFVRFSDDHSLYRAILVVLMFNFTLNSSIMVMGISIAMMYINSQFFDNFNLMEKDGDTDNKKYPPVEIIKLSPKPVLEKFLSVINRDNRVLFEYSGLNRDTSFRPVMILLEYFLHKRGVEFLPHEGTGYVYPKFFYDVSSNLSSMGNIDKVDKMSRECNINYFLVYSKPLIDRLVRRNYKILGKPDTRYNFTSVIQEEQVCFC